MLKVQASKIFLVCITTLEISRHNQVLRLMTPFNMGSCLLFYFMQNNQTWVKVVALDGFVFITVLQYTFYVFDKPVCF